MYIAVAQAVKLQGHLHIISACDNDVYVMDIVLIETFN